MTTIEEAQAVAGPAEIWGLRLDPPRSAVVIDEVPFPAATLRTPTGRRWGGPVFPRRGWASGWSVYVPMENGVVANVALEPLDTEGPAIEISVGLWCPVWRSDPGYPGSLVHGEATPMAIDGKRIVEFTPPFRSLAHCWDDDVDPVWIVETFARISRYKVDTPSGPAMKMTPLRNAYKGAQP